MNHLALQYAHYWRNSIADSENGRGAFKNDEAINKQFLYGSRQELKQGYIQDRKILNALFSEVKEDILSIKISIRPLIYRILLEHNQARKDRPQLITPLRMIATLNRQGELSPASIIHIPRDLLEPQDRVAFTLGNVGNMDAFLSKKPLPSVESNQKWQDSLHYAEELLSNIFQGWSVENSKLDKYVLEDDRFLVEHAPVSDTGQYILALYDHIQEHSPTTPLFETYTREKLEKPEPCFPATDTFSCRLGHASDQFELATAQRDALSHLMQAKHGDILAINGPPGTGKTTLLLSVVASLWAKAALTEDGEPPVILATSTNNQAVTNIITAFGHGFSVGSGVFAGRWLPDIHSFGAYFSSSTKKKQGSNLYQTESFFEQVEQKDYFDKAKPQFLDAVKTAFPKLTNPTLHDAVRILRQSIQEKVSQLNALTEVWSKLSLARQQTKQQLGDYPLDELQLRHQTLAKLEGLQAAYTQLLAKWEEYIANESFLYTLFSWFPPIATKRLYRLKFALKAYLPENFSLNACQHIKEVGHLINQQRQNIQKQYEAQQQYVYVAEQCLQKEQKQLQQWQQVLSPLGLEQQAAQLSLQDCEQQADTQIRFEIFLRTTHYWEARWLAETEMDLSSKEKMTTLEKAKKRWRKRMKLTPCIVSTFAMLPRHMQVFLPKDKPSDPWKYNYLYDFIDLLIVDEAGQVLPDVAGASFSLAKQALVIGDTLQIEPIWNIPTTVDQGNLIQSKLIPPQNIDLAYEQIKQSGKSAATGSVMQIAQQACRYHYDADLARGMFLYEHRRCYDDIIEYCNTLCYKGKLQPKRGRITDQQKLPAMGYLHIQGLCQLGRGGSRYNLLEAETIATWLIAHKDELEAQYNQPLKDIVGVITPFKGQLQQIRQACQKHGLDISKNSGMTIGTVHALQGAERPIILFSPVYSQHANGQFIDHSPSMLNVAVSRAKDSFLVFGDLDTFEYAPTRSPRNLLAQVLTQHPQNALSFHPLPRQDLGSHQVLRNAAEHDAFLSHAIQHAINDICIVSPWFIKTRLSESPLLQSFRNAIQRGVKITIYTDAMLNKDPQQLDQAIQFARKEGMHVVVVYRIHSKLVLIDDTLYCAGSFNWLSASRELTSDYTRYEVSLVYRGQHVAQEILAEKNFLQQLKTIT